MELDDFKEEWNQSEKGRNEFSGAHLKANSVIDKLVKTQMVQFGKVLLISLGLLIMGTVFISPSQTEGYLSTVIMVITCITLTIPIYLTFRRSIKMMKSLDISASVADSLRNYSHRVEAEIKVQKLIMVFVIILLLTFSFIMPSIFLSGFEIAAAVGTYTLVLLVYSYRTFKANLEKELTKLSHQLNESED